MGVGDAKQDPKLLENAMNDLAIISGQKPAVTAAKKSISNFKIILIILIILIIGIA